MRDILQSNWTHYLQNARAWSQGSTAPDWRRWDMTGSRPDPVALTDFTGTIRRTQKGPGG